MGWNNCSCFPISVQQCYPPMHTLSSESRELVVVFIFQTDLYFLPDRHINNNNRSIYITLGFMLTILELETAATEQTTK